MKTDFKITSFRAAHETWLNIIRVRQWTHWMCVCYPAVSREDFDLWLQITGNVRTCRCVSICVSLWVAQQSGCEIIPYLQKGYLSHFFTRYFHYNFCLKLSMEQQIQSKLIHISQEKLALSAYLGEISKKLESAICWLGIIKFTVSENILKRQH